MDDYDALVEFLRARFTEEETLWNNTSTVVVNMAHHADDAILPDPRVSRAKRSVRQA